MRFPAEAGDVVHRAAWKDLLPHRQFERQSQHDPGLFGVVARPFRQLFDEPVAAGDADLAQGQAVERRQHQSSSDRSTSLAFDARSAAAAVVPVLCTWRVLPPQSRYRQRASKRPDGILRVVRSPTVPIVSRGRDIRSPPVGGFALLGDPRPHIGDSEVQVIAKPVGQWAFAVHSPVVDLGQRNPTAEHELGNVHGSSTLVIG